MKNAANSISDSSFHLLCKSVLLSFSLSRSYFKAMFPFDPQNFCASLLFLYSTALVFVLRFFFLAVHFFLLLSRLDVEVVFHRNNSSCLCASCYLLIYALNLTIMMLIGFVYCSSCIRKFQRQLVNFCYSECQQNYLYYFLYLYTYILKVQNLPLFSVKTSQENVKFEYF